VKIVAKLRQYSKYKYTEDGSIGWPVSVVGQSWSEWSLSFEGDCDSGPQLLHLDL